ncbi:MAG: hypothetical protein IJH99_06005 [Eubacterium sp.]|nr:hypothetical protein [Eubacterium sp.]
MEDNKLNMVPEDCTHDCSTCAVACNTVTDKNEPYGMFEKMDALAQDLMNDDLQDMLNKLAAELDNA